MTRVLDAIDRAAEWLIAVIFGTIVCLALWQVFNRFVLNSSLSWSEEAQIFGHIWIVFLGIPIAYKRGAHLFIETFCDLLPAGPRAVFNLAVELLWAAFALSLMVLGFQVTQVGAPAVFPGLEVPMSVPYAGMVLGGAYLLLAARRIASGNWRLPAGASRAAEK